MSAALAGLFTGLSLIVAIGAQNAYVLRLGLTRHHVGVAVTICAASDAALIALGIGGLGRVVRSHPDVLEVLKWVGVVYLVGYAIHSFWRATRPEVLLPSETEPPSLKLVVTTMLAFTFLNPHVYLDTVLLLGTIGNQYGDDRWLFAAGAATGSVLWFTSLGFGARARGSTDVAPGDVAGARRRDRRGDAARRLQRRHHHDLDDLSGGCPPPTELGGVDLLGDDLRRAAGLHGDAVEAVGGLHGALLVADDDELGLVAELGHQAEEAVEVDVVEGGLDLVHHVEGRRAGCGTRRTGRPAR